MAGPGAKATLRERDGPELGLDFSLLAVESFTASDLSGFSAVASVLEESAAAGIVDDIALERDGEELCCQYNCASFLILYKS